MDSRPDNLLSCKVQIRKYVLIAHPSRWKQNGERVVVQSPMLTIPRTASQIPVRRYHGGEKNFVCFLPKADIEKDSKDVYEKSQVSREPSNIPAHGVALFNSAPDEDFEYWRDDKFWISIGTKTEGYEESVPVINLRTWESGTIRIDQVCWYPSIQGPDNELWTLGGKVGKLRLGGAKNMRTRSFVVCQHLDGRQSIAKNVEIPTSDVPMADRSLLTPKESRAMFYRLQRRMVDDAESKFESSSIVPPAFPIPSIVSHLPPTPPVSPDAQHTEKANEETNKKAESQIPASKSTDLNLWRRITAEARKGNNRTRGPYLLRPSTIHPQHFSSPHEHSTNSKDEDDSLSDSDDEECLIIPELQLDGLDIFGATNPTLHSQDRNEPVISLTDPAVMRDPITAISNWYKKNEPKHNPLVDGLCNENDPRCPYTTQSTTQHFHAPHSKCRRFKPTAPFISSRALYRVPKFPIHDHCVSRLGPYPHTPGECLLATSPQHPNHKCCIWDPRDLEGIPVVPGPQVENVKVAEARRKRMKIHDTRLKVELHLAAGFEVDDISGEGLGPAGESFVNYLKAGGMEEEVRELRGVELGRFSSSGEVDWDKEFGL